MRITIRKGKESSILYDGKFYDTGVPLDLSFSEAIRLSRVCEVDMDSENVPYDPRLWQEEQFFNFIANVEQISGFGGVSFNLLKYSAKDYKISLVGSTMGVKDQEIFAMKNRPVLQEGAAVWHDQPRHTWLYSPFKKNICIVPFETTVIPRSWIGKINGFDALLVPCKQNIEAFRNSGVKIPIELIHWGVEPKAFYPLERKQPRVFTFGSMGYLTARKGTDMLISAFQEAFPIEKDVRLVLKTSAPHWEFPYKDDRIKLQMGQFTHQELINDFFSEIDCFVFPTRGEGFGLTPLEAMATGVPAIVTGWAGPLEYMTPEVGWLLDYKLTRASAFTDQVYKEECGDWAEPSREHLIQLMRHAYTHRDEVAVKGAAAARYVQENWLWSQKIGMFHEALAKYL